MSDVCIIVLNARSPWPLLVSLKSIALQTDIRFSVAIGLEHPLATGHDVIGRVLIDHEVTVHQGHASDELVELVARSTSESWLLPVRSGSSFIDGSSLRLMLCSATEAVDVVAFRPLDLGPEEPVDRSRRWDDMTLLRRPALLRRSAVVSMTDHTAQSAEEEPRNVLHRGRDAGLRFRFRERPPFLASSL